MRQTRTLALLAGKPWMFDFRSDRVYMLPAQTHTLARNLTPFFNTWDGAASWRLWYANLKYLDYEDEERVRAEDERANMEKHETGLQPGQQIEEYLQSSTAIPLPEPLCGVGAWSIVSTLLHLSLRRQALQHFHADVVQLKPSPSVGARHGIEAFISIGSTSFYYDCVGHTLVPLSSDSGLRRCPGEISIHLCFRPDVYMWRYESGNCLVDVYLDAGHVVGNLSLAASLIGCPRPILHPFDRPPVANIARLVALISFSL